MRSRTELMFQVAKVMGMKKVRGRARTLCLSGADPVKRQVVGSTALNVGSM
jgi:hypothetical protein